MSAGKPESPLLQTTLIESNLRSPEGGGAVGIGKLRCAVVDVEDLEVAEAFWSEVTGLPVIPSVFPGRYSYLGQPEPWHHELILHKVSTHKGPEANRGHVDIGVSDLDRAIAQVETSHTGAFLREILGRPAPVVKKAAPRKRADSTSAEH